MSRSILSRSGNAAISASVAMGVVPTIRLLPDLVPHGALEWIAHVLRLLPDGHSLVVTMEHRRHRLRPMPLTGSSSIDSALHAFEQSGDAFSAVSTTLSINGEAAVGWPTRTAIEGAWSNLAASLGEVEAPPAGGADFAWKRVGGTGDTHIEEAPARHLAPCGCGHNLDLDRAYTIRRRAVRTATVSRRDRLVGLKDLEDLSCDWTLRSEFSPAPFLTIEKRVFVGQTLIVSAATEGGLPERTAIAQITGRRSRWWPRRPFVMSIDRVAAELELRTDHTNAVPLEGDRDRRVLLRLPVLPGGVYPYSGRSFLYYRPHTAIIGDAETGAGELSLAILSGVLRHSGTDIVLVNAPCQARQWLLAAGGTLLSAPGPENANDGLLQFLQAATPQHEDIYAHWLHHMLGSRADAYWVAERLASRLVNTLPAERSIDRLLDAITDDGLKNQLRTRLALIGKWLPRGLLNGHCPGYSPAPIAIDVREAGGPLSFMTITVLAALSVRAYTARSTVLYLPDLTALLEDEDASQFLWLYLRLARIRCVDMLFHLDPAALASVRSSVTDVTGTFWIMPGGGRDVESLASRFWTGSMADHVQEIARAIGGRREALLLRPDEGLALRVKAELHGFMNGGAAAGALPLGREAAGEHPADLRAVP